MQVLVVQADVAWEDKPTNHARVEERLAAAAPPRDALVILPEMFATGFSMNVDAVADDTHPDAASHPFCQRLAREHGVFLVAGLVTRGDDGRGRNQAVVYGPDGRELGRYTKQHPFGYAGEDRHYRAGHETRVVGCGGFNLAPLICYDLRFPETFRAAMRQGADLFVVIANWPASRQAHWSTLLRARAIENQAYVVGANRVGTDPQVAYAGGSQVISPRGEILATAGDQPAVLTASLDHAALEQYRREFPFLADARF